MLILIAKVITYIFLHFFLASLLSEDYLGMFRKTRRKKNSSCSFSLANFCLLSPFTLFIFRVCLNPVMKEEIHYLAN